MNNKIKKSITTILTIIIFLIALTSKVQAESFYEGEWIPDIYIKKEYYGYQKYQQAEFFRRTSDNADVYCLEPFIKIIKNTEYEEITNNYANRLGIPKPIWTRIAKLAYYGYNYQNHTDSKWYFITQVLIWRAINKDYNIYFTNKLNGVKVANAYQEEIKELEDLVARHDLTPSFASDSYDINFNEELLLKDVNNVLSDYVITASTIPASITDNELKITPNSLGKQEITLTKTNNNYNRPIIAYNADESQNVFQSGNLDSQTVTITINVKGPSLKIIKQDIDTKENISLANLKFRIKDLTTNKFLSNPDSPEKSDIFTTNQMGEIIIDNLSFGSFAIYEESDIPGYKRKEEPNIIELTPSSTYKNNDGKLYYEEKFYNEKALGNIKIFKKGECIPSSSDEDKLLENVKIGLYAKEDIKDINNTILYPKDTLIAVKTTNENGILEFNNLYLGKYYIKELEAPANYILDKKIYTLDLDSNSTSDVFKTKTLYNYLKKGKVALTKQDSLSKNALSGVKINLYQEDNTLIYQGITDEEGKITIESLALGTYYFEEIETLDGYTLNTQKIYFTVKEDQENINLVFENDPIIAIPDTYIGNCDASIFLGFLALGGLLWRKKEYIY